MLDISDISYVNEPWRDEALCQGDTEDLFFPDPSDIGRISAAKAVCASCPVRDQCLAYAIETDQPEGIWGGMTPQERKKLRREWMKEIRRAS